MLFNDPLLDGISIIGFVSHDISDRTLYKGSTSVVSIGTYVDEMRESNVLTTMSKGMQCDLRILNVFKVLSIVYLNEAAKDSFIHNNAKRCVSHQFLLSQIPYESTRYPGSH